MQLVWLKRDLRVSDHEPLRLALGQASAAGSVLVCYFHEPALLSAPDSAAQHLAFVQETLAQIRQTLQGEGSDLMEVCADAPAAFAALAHLKHPSCLWAHQETTHSRGFARDQEVSRWARSLRLRFFEVPQNAVTRGSTPRPKNHFSAHLQEVSNQPLWNLRRAPEAERRGLMPAKEVRRLEKQLRQALGPLAERAPEEFIREHREPGWMDDAPVLRYPSTQDKALRLSGGRSAALEQMQRFLQPDNLLAYPGAISSPLTALEHCSRLSPYLALGVVSDRELFQALCVAMTEGGTDEEVNRLESPSRFFVERLYWRAAYLQAMERQSDLDLRAGMPVFNGLREAERMNGWLQAWAAGMTGFPLVDAAMRMLNATGWLNMRLRGTVTSFALNDLWLPWQEVGMVLAREFLDYEPAIHWSQLQIHAGVSSHSGPLTYDVVKQAREHDPRGIFVRQWVPELREVPAEYIFEPWRMPAAVQRSSNCVLGMHYPAPLVRHPVANDAARERVAALREGTEPPGGLYWKQRNQQVAAQGQGRLF